MTPQATILGVTFGLLGGLAIATAPPLGAQQPPPAAAAQASAEGGRGRGPQAPQGPRLKALIVSGGCCHDYALQDKIMMDVMAKVLPIDWTVVVQGGGGTRARLPIYDNPDWIKGFDIVVHNECSADVDDDAFVKRITEPHRAGKIPALVIHCSMHSYRALTTDPWREFLGVTSKRHTAAHNVGVTFTAKDHPVVQGMSASWTTPTDELYVIDKVWPNTVALATAVSPEDQQTYPVAWAHEFGGARVFGTTLGHGNDTWNDPVFQDLLRRGFRWAVNK
ncbi:MAG: ThuA domain-containing protein [Vicinamibacterales bacterium]